MGPGRQNREDLFLSLEVRACGGRMVAESTILDSLAANLVENHTKGMKFEDTGLCTKLFMNSIAEIHFTLSLAAGLRKCETDIFLDFTNRGGDVHLSIYLFTYWSLNFTYGGFTILTPSPHAKNLLLSTSIPTITPVKVIFFRNERLWFFN